MSSKRVPTGWTEARLAEVAEINPANPDVRPDDDTPVSFVPMAAVQPNGRGIDTHQIRPWGTVKKGYKRFQDGDVLFAKITPCMENGKLAVAAGLHNGVGAGSTEFHVLRPSSTVRPDLLAYYLLRDDFRASARAKMTGTAGQLRVPQRFLEAQTLPIPPLDEQKQIGETIDSYFCRLDAVTSTLQRVRRNLKRYRASILKAAVEGRLVPTEAELARAEGRDYEPASVLLKRILTERRRRWEECELARIAAAGTKPRNDGWKAKYREPNAPNTAALPPLPDGWCWATVDQVLSEPLANGRSVKSARRGFPVLRLTSIQNGGIDLRERKTGAWTARDAEPFLVRAGDFFVSRGNGSLHLVGAGGLVCQSPDPVAFPDTLIRIRLCSGIDARFFATIWNSRILRDQLEGKAKTTAGIFKVSQHDLATCAVPLPPYSEQIRIRIATDRVSADNQVLIDMMTKSTLQAPQLRQSILRRAFAGVLPLQARRPHCVPASTPSTVPAA